MQTQELMNTDTFTSLKKLMDNLECDANGNPGAVNEIRTQCEKVLYLIQHLQFSNNSAHVQLATKQALQYIHSALSAADVYTASFYSVNKKENMMDICGPAHAGLEIILNLDY